MVQQVRRVARKAVKTLFHTLGLDIVRIKNVPRMSLAGLVRRPFATIIDCGANEGQFAKFASELFPNAKFFCFEPLAEPFERLSAWADTQHGRVHCFKSALGAIEGEVSMNLHVEHTASSSILSTTEHEQSLFPQTQVQTTVTVPITTLDATMSQVVDGLDGLVMLKLDVQGYEDRVLQGAEKILQSVDACLLEVSVDPLYETQASFKNLVDILDRYQLRYAGNVDQSYGEDSRIMWLDALFLRRST